MCVCDAGSSTQVVLIWAQLHTQPRQYPVTAGATLLVLNYRSQNTQTRVCVLFLLMEWVLTLTASLSLLLSLLCSLIHSFCWEHLHIWGQTHQSVPLYKCVSELLFTEYITHTDTHTHSFHADGFVRNASSSVSQWTKWDFHTELLETNECLMSRTFMKHRQSHLMTLKWLWLVTVLVGVHWFMSFPSSRAVKAVTAWNWNDSPAMVTMTPVGHPPQQVVPS